MKKFVGTGLMAIVLIAAAVLIGCLCFVPWQYLGHGTTVLGCIAVDSGAILFAAALGLAIWDEVSR